MRKTDRGRSVFKVRMGCSDLPSVELTDLTELSLPSPKHDDYGLNNFYSISLYFLMRIDSIWTHHQHQQIYLQNN